MSSIRVKLSQITAKKVPALALIVVGIAGMVAGVFAAAITINPVSYSGETGTFHNNTGAFTVTDNGLAIVANGVSTNATSAVTLGASGVALNNALTADHWMDVVTFSMGSPAAGTHTATITFRNGTGPQGSTLVSVTSGTWTTSSSSTGTITFYIDLGTASITAPITAYVSVT